jgi:bis(5'-nucleosidyl)-tetraphosphatase
MSDDPSLFPFAASPQRSAPEGASRAARPRGKTPKSRREFSAGFVLFRDTPEGPLFLLLDYGRHWDYAKGHLEDGESQWQAAVRELREETGIRRVERVGRFKYDIDYTFRSPKKGRVDKTVTFFLGKTDVSKVELSDEHSGHAWLAYEQALEKLTFGNARQLLRAAWRALAESAAKRVRKDA